MAAALLFRRTPPEEVTVSVSSAGLMAGGRIVPPEVLEVMAPYGEDLSGHESRQVTASDVADADLVVAMSRHHAREVVLLDPDAFGRTFTLKDLVRRGEVAGARDSSEGLDAWLTRVGGNRKRLDLVGTSAADDLPDPIRGPIEKYRATAAAIDELCGRLAALLWPRSTYSPGQAGDAEGARGDG